MKKKRYNNRKRKFKYIYMAKSTKSIAEEGLCQQHWELGAPEVFGHVHPAPLSEVALVYGQGFSTAHAPHFCEAAIMILH